MQKMIKIVVLFLFTLCAASYALAENRPTYEMNLAGHFSSRVNVYNQSVYSYTVYATYVDQAGSSRKYTMALNPYPLSGSSIMFPVTLPEYAVYLEIIRNIDSNVAYRGYVSSDDIYIRSALANATPVVSVNHH